MPVYRCRNLGGVGVIKDNPAYDLDPNGWSDALNVRFYSSQISKMGGNMEILKDGFPDNTTPLSICQRPNTKEIIYGTKNKIYRVDETGHHLETTRLNSGQPVAYHASPDKTWYYTSLSNAVVMNNVVDEPQGLLPNATNFVDLPKWGIGNHTSNEKKYWRTPLIRTFSSYLICFGMYEGIDDQQNDWYPQRLRWSDVVQTNGLPENWHEDDKNTDGGFLDLTNAYGALVDGVPLQDKLIVYTERETYMMELVSGVDVFQIRKIFGDSGLLAPECAVEIDSGRHFVITQNDIVIHNGNTRQSVVTSKVKDYLFSEIGATNPAATKCFAYPKRKEVWIQYVGPGSTSDPQDTDDTKSFCCTKCAIYNYEFDTWTFYEIAPSYDINSCVNISDSDKDWENFWADATGQWNNDAVQDIEWSPNYSQSFKQQVLMSASKDKKLYALDVGYRFHYLHTSTPAATADNPHPTPVVTEVVRPVVARLERVAYDFDEMVDDIQYHKIWTQIVPQALGYGSLRVEIGGSNLPNQMVQYLEQNTFKIGEDDKIDCLSNFRYPALRITDSGASEWSLSTFDITFVTEGKV